jgi:hypothetical protein
MTFKMNLSNVEHEFTDHDFRRPEIQILIDLKPYHEEHNIIVRIGEEYGQHERCIELLPEQAIEIGKMLQLIGENIEEHLEIKLAEEQEEAAE